MTVPHGSGAPTAAAVAASAATPADLPAAAPAANSGQRATPVNRVEDGSCFYLQEAASHLTKGKSPYFRCRSVSSGGSTDNFSTTCGRAYSADSSGNYRTHASSVECRSCLQSSGERKNCLQRKAGHTDGLIVFARGGTTSVSRNPGAGAVALENLEISPFPVTRSEGVLSSRLFPSETSSGVPHEGNCCGAGLRRDKHNSPEEDNHVANSSYRTSKRSGSNCGTYEESNVNGCCLSETPNDSSSNICTGYQNKSCSSGHISIGYPRVCSSSSNIGTGCNDDNNFGSASTMCKDGNGESYFCLVTTPLLDSSTSTTVSTPSPAASSTPRSARSSSLEIDETCCLTSTCDNDCGICESAGSWKGAARENNGWNQHETSPSRRCELSSPVAFLGRSSCYPSFHPPTNRVSSGTGLPADKFAEASSLSTTGKANEKHSAVIFGETSQARGSDLPGTSSMQPRTRQAANLEVHHQLRPTNTEVTPARHSPAEEEELVLSSSVFLTPDVLSRVKHEPPIPGNPFVLQAGGPLGDLAVQAGAAVAAATVVGRGAGGITGHCCSSSLWSRRDSSTCSPGVFSQLPLVPLSAWPAPVSLCRAGLSPYQNTGVPAAHDSVESGTGSRSANDIACYDMYGEDRAVEQNLAHPAEYANRRKGLFDPGSQPTQGNWRFLHGQPRAGFVSGTADVPPPELTLPKLYREPPQHSGTRSSQATQTVSSPGSEGLLTPSIDHEEDPNAFSIEMLASNNNESSPSLRSCLGLPLGIPAPTDCWILADVARATTSASAAGAGRGWGAAAEFGCSSCSSMQPATLLLGDSDCESILSAGDGSVCGSPSSLKQQQLHVKVGELESTTASNCKGKDGVSVYESLSLLKRQQEHTNVNGPESTACNRDDGGELSLTSNSSHAPNFSVPPERVGSLSTSQSSSSDRAPDTNAQRGEALALHVHLQQLRDHEERTRGNAPQDREDPLQQHDGEGSQRGKQEWQPAGSDRGHTVVAAQGQGRESTDRQQHPGVATGSPSNIRASLGAPVTAVATLDLQLPARAATATNGKDSDDTAVHGQELLLPGQPSSRKDVREVAGAAVAGGRYSVSPQNDETVMVAAAAAAADGSSSSPQKMVLPLPMQPPSSPLHMNYSNSNNNTRKETCLLLHMNSAEPCQLSPADAGQRQTAVLQGADAADSTGVSPEAVFLDICAARTAGRNLRFTLPLKRPMARVCSNEVEPHVGTPANDGRFLNSSSFKEGLYNDADNTPAAAPTAAVAAAVVAGGGASVDEEQHQDVEMTPSHVQASSSGKRGRRRSAAPAAEVKTDERLQALLEEDCVVDAAAAYLPGLARPPAGQQHHHRRHTKEQEGTVCNSSSSSSTSSSEYKRRRAAGGDQTDHPARRWSRSSTPDGSTVSSTSTRSGPPSQYTSRSSSTRCSPHSSIRSEPLGAAVTASPEVGEQAPATVDRSSLCPPADHHMLPSVPALCEPVHVQQMELYKTSSTDVTQCNAPATSSVAPPPPAAPHTSSLDTHFDGARAAKFHVVHSAGSDNHEAPAPSPMLHPEPTLPTLATGASKATGAAVALPETAAQMFLRAAQAPEESAACQISVCLVDTAALQHKRRSTSESGGQEGKWLPVLPETQAAAPPLPPSLAAPTTGVTATIPVPLPQQGTNVIDAPAAAGPPNETSQPCSMRAADGLGGPAAEALRGPAAALLDVSDACSSHLGGPAALESIFVPPCGTAAADARAEDGKETAVGCGETAAAKSGLSCGSGLASCLPGSSTQKGEAGDADAESAHHLQNTDRRQAVVHGQTGCPPQQRRIIASNNAQRNELFQEGPPAPPAQSEAVASEVQPPRVAREPALDHQASAQAECRLSVEALVKRPAAPQTAIPSDPAQQPVHGQQPMDGQQPVRGHQPLLQQPQEVELEKQSQQAQEKLAQQPEQQHSPPCAQASQDVLTASLAEHMDDRRSTRALPSSSIDSSASFVTCEPTRERHAERLQLPNGALESGSCEPDSCGAQGAATGEGPEPAAPTFASNTPHIAATGEKTEPAALPAPTFASSSPQRVATREEIEVSALTAPTFASTGVDYTNSLHDSPSLTRASGEAAFPCNLSIEGTHAKRNSSAEEATGNCCNGGSSCMEPHEKRNSTDSNVINGYSEGGSSRMQPHERGNNAAGNSEKYPSNGDSSCMEPQEEGNSAAEVPHKHSSSGDSSCIERHQKRNNSADISDNCSRGDSSCMKTHEKRSNSAEEVSDNYRSVAGSCMKPHEAGDSAAKVPENCFEEGDSSSTGPHQQRSSSPEDAADSYFNRDSSFMEPLEENTAEINDSDSNGDNSCMAELLRALSGGYDSTPRNESNSCSSLCPESPVRATAASPRSTASTQSATRDYSSPSSTASAHSATREYSTQRESCWKEEVLGGEQQRLCLSDPFADAGSSRAPVTTADANMKTGGATQQPLTQPLGTQPPVTQPPIAQRPVTRPRVTQQPATELPFRQREWAEGREGGSQQQQQLQQLQQEEEQQEKQQQLQQEEQQEEQQAICPPSPRGAVEATAGGTRLLGPLIRAGETESGTIQAHAAAEATTGRWVLPPKANTETAEHAAQGATATEGSARADGMTGLVLTEEGADCASRNLKVCSWGVLQQQQEQQQQNGLQDSSASLTVGAAADGQPPRDELIKTAATAGGCELAKAAAPERPCKGDGITVPHTHHDAAAAARLSAAPNAGAAAPAAVSAAHITAGNVASATTGSAAAGDTQLVGEGWPHFSATGNNDADTQRPREYLITMSDSRWIALRRSGLFRLGDKGRASIKSRIAKQLRLCPDLRRAAAAIGGGGVRCATTKQLYQLAELCGFDDVLPPEFRRQRPSSEQETDAGVAAENPAAAAAGQAEAVRVTATDHTRKCRTNKASGSCSAGGLLAVSKKRPAPAEASADDIYSFASNTTTSSSSNASACFGNNVGVLAAAQYDCISSASASGRAPGGAASSPGAATSMYATNEQAENLHRLFNEPPGSSLPGICRLRRQQHQQQQHLQRLQQQQQHQQQQHLRHRQHQRVASCIPQEGTSHSLLGNHHHRKRPSAVTQVLQHEAVAWDCLLVQQQQQEPSSLSPTDPPLQYTLRLLDQQQQQQEQQQHLAPPQQQHLPPPHQQQCYRQPLQTHQQPQQELEQEHHARSEEPHQGRVQQQPQQLAAPCDQLEAHQALMPVLPDDEFLGVRPLSKDRHPTSECSPVFVDAAAQQQPFLSLPGQQQNTQKEAGSGPAENRHHAAQQQQQEGLQDDHVMLRRRPTLPLPSHEETKKPPEFYYLQGVDGQASQQQSPPHYDQKQEQQHEHEFKKVQEVYCLRGEDSQTSQQSPPHHHQKHEQEQKQEKFTRMLTGPFAHADTDGQAAARGLVDAAPARIAAAAAAATETLRLASCNPPDSTLGLPLASEEGAAPVAAGGLHAGDVAAAIVVTCPPPPPALGSTNASTRRNSTSSRSSVCSGSSSSGSSSSSVHSSSSSCSTGNDDIRCKTSWSRRKRSSTGNASKWQNTAEDPVPVLVGSSPLCPSNQHSLQMRHTPPRHAEEQLQQHGQLQQHDRQQQQQQEQTLLLSGCPTATSKYEWIVHDPPMAPGDAGTAQSPDKAQVMNTLASRADAAAAAATGGARHAEFAGAPPAVSPELNRAGKGQKLPQQEVFALAGVASSSSSASAPRFPRTQEGSNNNNLPRVQPYHRVLPGPSPHDSCPTSTNLQLHRHIHTSSSSSTFPYASTAATSNGACCLVKDAVAVEDTSAIAGAPQGISSITASSSAGPGALPPPLPRAEVTYARMNPSRATAAAAPALGASCHSPCASAVQGGCRIDAQGPARQEQQPSFRTGPLLPKKRRRVDVPAATAAAAEAAAAEAAAAEAAAATAAATAQQAVSPSVAYLRSNEEHSPPTTQYFGMPSQHHIPSHQQHMNAPSAAPALYSLHGCQEPSAQSPQRSHSDRLPRGSTSTPNAHVGQAQQLHVAAEHQQEQAHEQEQEQAHEQQARAHQKLQQHAPSQQRIQQQARAAQQRIRQHSWKDGGAPLQLGACSGSQQLLDGLPLQLGACPDPQQLLDGLDAGAHNLTAKQPPQSIPFGTAAGQEINDHKLHGCGNPGTYTKQQRYVCGDTGTNDRQQLYVSGPQSLGSASDMQTSHTSSRRWDERSDAPSQTCRTDQHYHRGSAIASSRWVLPATGTHVVDEFFSLC